MVLVATSWGGGQFMKLGLSLLAVAVLTVGMGCSTATDEGASTEGASTMPTSTSADSNAKTELQEAAETYAEAYYEADPELGYRYLNEQCKTELAQVDFATRAEADRIPGRSVEGVLVVVDGETGRVIVDFSDDPAESEVQRWTRESTEWALDDCPQPAPTPSEPSYEAPAPQAEVPQQRQQQSTVVAPQTTKLESGCSDVTWRLEMGLEGDRLCGSTLFRDGKVPWY